MTTTTSLFDNHRRPMGALPRPMITKLNQQDTTAARKKVDAARTQIERHNARVELWGWTRDRK